jgi:hypothetical protein
MDSELEISTEQPKLTQYQRYRTTINNWKKENREKHNEHNKLYREKNKERLRLYQAEYRKKKNLQNSLALVAQ